MRDPYPEKSFDELLRVLEIRFGVANVTQHPSGGDVNIHMSLATGETFCAVLTWQQAKYLAINPLSAEDLKASRFPAEWPQDQKPAVPKVQ